jgi:hypothetical protein
MKHSVSRTDVWAATIDDRPGGLAEKLEALAAAGANLEFLIGRRMPEQRGKGVVFVTPLKGVKQLKAAQRAGFEKTESLHSLRVEGSDKVGTGAKLTKALADGGVNLRGISAAAFGKKFVLHLALDSAKDAAKAAGILKKLA